MPNAQPTNGIDNITQGAGDDTLTFRYQSSVNAGDFFDGGTGNNTISAGGDYNSSSILLLDYSVLTTDANHGLHNYQNLTFGPEISIELVVFDGAQFGNGLISNNLNVTGASTLFRAQEILITNAHNFSMAGWTFTDWSHGSLKIMGGTGDDTIVGNSQGKLENIDLSQGGSDTLTGGTARDIVDMGGALDPNDRIDGGTGAKNDFILAGDYSAGVVFNDTTCVNFAHIAMRAGYSYNLTSADGMVKAGQDFDLGAANSDGLVFDGSAETDGSFTFHLSKDGAGNTIIGSVNKDTFVNGSGDDTFTGAGGNDVFQSGSGHDTFIYTAASDSTGTKHDQIDSFNASLDHFIVPIAVTAVDAEIVGGKLATPTFDTDMATAMSGLLPGHAVVFDPSSGNLSSHLFLVIDQDGVAGYTTGADLVIRIDGAANLNHLTTGSFST